MLSAEARDALRPDTPIGGIEPLRLFSAVAPATPANDVGPACPATAPRWWSRAQPGLKRALDVVGAATLLVLLSPLMLVLAALVKRDGGPAFYSHTRVGRDGRLFGCLKFRSMVIDSDRRLAALLAADPAARAEWEATRKLRQDPRVTAVGRFLRSSSLDELPQLLNVLRGEMSLVGPRPVQQAELETFYGAAAAHYRSVRPGITGLWQVSGRSETSYERRVQLDVAYVARASLLEDLRILLRTPIAVLRRRGAC